MGAVKAHSWKELVEKAEIIEQQITPEESSSAPRQKWTSNNKNRDGGQASRSKGKETLTVDLSGNQSKPKNESDAQESKPR